MSAMNKEYRCPKIFILFKGFIYTHIYIYIYIARSSTKRMEDGLKEKKERNKNKYIKIQIICYYDIRSM